MKHPPAYIAPPPGKWTERYASPGRPERPLRLLLVGHNPSEHAWLSGHFYSNPSNRMWKLLAESGLIPTDWDRPADHRMPHDLGIGFTDVGVVPGNDAGAYDRETMRAWRDDFFQRLAAHVGRAGAEPRFVAFTGKRQWKELFDPVLKTSTLGVQDPALRPTGWPLTSACVFVLTSSSGRAAMKDAARIAPYRELAELVQGVEWPLP